MSVTSIKTEVSSSSEQDQPVKQESDQTEKNSENSQGPNRAEIKHEPIQEDVGNEPFGQPFNHHPSSNEMHASFGFLPNQSIPFSYFPFSEGYCLTELTNKQFVATHLPTYPANSVPSNPDDRNKTVDGATKPKSMGSILSDLFPTHYSAQATETECAQDKTSYGVPSNSNSFISTSNKRPLEPEDFSQNGSDTKQVFCGQNIGTSNFTNVPYSLDPFHQPYHQNQAQSLGMGHNMLYYPTPQGNNMFVANLPGYVNMNPYAYPGNSTVPDGVWYNQVAGTDSQRVVHNSSGFNEQTSSSQAESQPEMFNNAHRKPSSGSKKFKKNAKRNQSAACSGDGAPVMNGVFTANGEKIRRPPNAFMVFAKV